MTTTKRYEKRQKKKREDKLVLEAFRIAVETLEKMVKRRKKEGTIFRCG